MKQLYQNFTNQIDYSLSKTANVIFIVLGLLITLLFAYRYPSEASVLDDFYIVMTFSRNLVDRGYLYPNNLDTFASYTSLIHTLLLSVVYSFTQKISEIMFFIGAFYLAVYYAAMLVISRIFLPLFSAVILSVGVTTHFAISHFAYAGLETTFYAASVLLCFYFAFKLDLWRCCFLAAVCLLNRLEFALLLPILSFYFLIFGNSVTLFSRFILINLAIIISLCMFHYFYHGAPFPLPFYLKTSSSIYTVLQGFDIIARQAHYSNIDEIFVICLMASAWFVYRLSKQHNWSISSFLFSPKSDREKEIGFVLLLILASVIYVFYQIYVGGDWAGARFITHWLGLVVVCSVGVMKFIFQPLLESGFRYKLGSFLVAVLLASSLSKGVVENRNANVILSLAGLIKLLDAFHAEQSSDGHYLVASWAGVPSYFWNGKFSDTWGYFDPIIAHRNMGKINQAADVGVAGHRKQNNFFVINNRKPDYLLNSIAADGHQLGVAAPLDQVPFRFIVDYRLWYEVANLIAHNITGEVINVSNELNSRRLNEQKFFDIVKSKELKIFPFDRKNPNYIDFQGLSKRRDREREKFTLNQLDFLNIDGNQIEANNFSIIKFNGATVTHPMFFSEGSYFIDITCSELNKVALFGQDETEMNLMISQNKYNAHSRVIVKVEEADVGKPLQFKFNGFCDAVIEVGRIR